MMIDKNTGVNVTYIIIDLDQSRCRKIYKLGAPLDLLEIPPYKHYLFFVEYIHLGYMCVHFAKNTYEIVRLFCFSSNYINLVTKDSIV